MEKKPDGSAAATNRAGWNSASDEYQARHGASLEETARGWGTWRLLDEEVGAIGDVGGRAVLELGCGAAQWSQALKEDGARVVGLDLSERQLVHALGRLRAAGTRLPLVQAGAESLPFAEASFDLVFCDYGAMSFADPRRTVPEVARVLRPAGRFVFCTSTPLRDLTVEPERGLPGETLIRSYFDLGRLDGEEEVMFQLPYGEWIRLFRGYELEVEDLIELRPAEGATTTFDDYVSPDWARRWPTDHVWKLRKRSGPLP